MAKSIDVYRDWLGIAQTQRPLNYYQLLRLKQFEDDPAKLREHYRKMNAYVRKFAAGDYARQSQELLNELSRAMLCLTDARRKREYDASLGRSDRGEGLRRTLEEILLARKAVDAAALDKARRYASAVGVDVRDALVQQRLVPPEVVMPAFAESVGLPYVELADVPLDEALLARVPAVLARQHSCAPLMIDEGQLLVASPNVLNPAVEEELRLRVGMPVRGVLCSPADIHGVMARYYPRQAAEAEVSNSGRHAIASARPPAPKDKPADPLKPRPAPAAVARRQMAALAGFTFAAAAGVGTALWLFRWSALVASSFALALGLLVVGAIWLAMTPRHDGNS